MMGTVRVSIMLVQVQRRTVNFGVSSIPQAVESSSPWRNPSRQGQEDENGKGDGKSDDDKGAEQELELLAWNQRPNDFDE
jgi:hypothetical protein